MKGYKKDGNWGLLFRWGLNAPDSEAAVFHVAPPIPAHETSRSTFRALLSTNNAAADKRSSPSRIARHHEL